LNSIPNCHVVERSSQCHLFLDSSSIGGAFAGLYCGGAGWMGNHADINGISIQVSVEGIEQGVIPEDFGIQGLEQEQE